MSRATAAAIFVALAVAGTARAVPAADGEVPSERLVVTGPAWSIEARPLTLAVETRGALAERPASLLVFVDGRQVAEAKTEGNTARVEVPGAALAAGSRRILIKTGSERSWIDVRVLPRLWLWGGGAVLLAGAVGIAAVARRSRSRR